MVQTISCRLDSAFILHNSSLPFCPLDNPCIIDIERFKQMYLSNCKIQSAQTCVHLWPNSSPALYSAPSFTQSLSAEALAKEDQNFLFLFFPVSASATMDDRLQTMDLGFTFSHKTSHFSNFFCNPKSLMSIISYLRSKMPPDKMARLYEPLARPEAAIPAPMGLRDMAIRLRRT